MLHMDYQTLFNLALGAFGFLATTMIRSALAQLKEQKQKLEDLRVHLAAEYVRRAEFERVITGVYLKLDRIIDKLEAKADRD